MIEGNGPRMKRPGGGPAGVSAALATAEARASEPILFKRAECVELCRPSDRCEDVRSMSEGCEPNALPDRMGKNSLDDLEA